MGQGTTVPGNFDVDLVIYSESKDNFLCVSIEFIVFCVSEIKRKRVLLFPYVTGFAKRSLVCTIINI